jgi:hypothetical protein
LCQRSSGFLRLTILLISSKSARFVHNSPSIANGGLSLKDAKSFRQRYLLLAISNNLIEMTQPDKPNSPTQKYRLV